MHETMTAHQEYKQILARLTATYRALTAANENKDGSDLTMLNWSIGRIILNGQQRHEWGAWLLIELATDLGAAFPGQRGFSLRNLQYMRACAKSWSNPQQDHSIRRLPWGHVTVLLDKLAGTPWLNWYAQEAADNAWSRTALTENIRRQAHLTTARDAGPPPVWLTSSTRRGPSSNVA
jgi:hypothetical protein